WQAIVLTLQPVILDRHVLAFDVAGFVEAFAKRGCIARVGLGRPVSDKPNHRHRPLLRTRRERPRCGRAAEECDELATVHSITSSARASSVSGTVRPRAFAVCELITSSNLFGVCTGSSPGLVPRRMRST